MELLCNANKYISESMLFSKDKNGRTMHHPHKFGLTNTQTNALANIIVKYGVSSKEFMNNEYLKRKYPKLIDFFGYEYMLFGDCGNSKIYFFSSSLMKLNKLNDNDKENLCNGVVLVQSAGNVKDIHTIFTPNIFGEKSYFNDELINLLKSMFLDIRNDIDIYEEVIKAKENAVLFDCISPRLYLNEYGVQCTSWVKVKGIDPFIELPLKNFIGELDFKNKIQNNFKTLNRLIVYIKENGKSKTCEFLKVDKRSLNNFIQYLLSDFSNEIALPFTVMRDINYLNIVKD